MTFGAEIGLQRQNVHHLFITREFLVNGIQEPPVAGTPAIDALFDVAYNKILGVDMAHALLQ